MGRLHRGFDDGRGLEKSRARVRRAMMGRAHGRVVVVVERDGGSDRTGWEQSQSVGRSLEV